MQDLITQFGLDWKLLLAQVVNFTILLYILKRFAYGPILKVLNERRNKIVEGLEAGEQAKKKLEESEVMKKQIIQKAEKEAVVIVNKAEDTAKVQEKSILAQAHKKEEQIVASGQKRLDEERLKLGEEVIQSAEVLVKTSLAKVLGKMHPNDRDNALIQEALSELKTASR